MKKIEGRNPVLEALKAGRKLKEILVYRQAEGLGEVINLAKQQKINIKEVSKKKLDELADSYAHQGIIAFGEVISYLSLDELIAQAYEETEAPLFILLDEIQDPYNLGSILRSANAVGAQGVIIPKRRSAGLSSAVAKASAGAVEYIPLAQVTNLVRSIKQLKEEGFWIAGADVEGEQVCYQADLTGALGIVIGSEDSGLRRLVKENCDFLVHLPMEGEIASLNASVAAALMMYEALRQQKYRD
ncbi:23S rRNA (guanosine(2251)-2'-O)-methyltransferase RlmB [Fuchsiella alkaliacetigena]|uniref:23S rRNA (guanosine(2251)-2'-O)-methyltransferase RlmB n=1 Tax=Fuchsiella alkaliacetigena TaxID=957042 RepID=UPI00200A9FA5|nr:23S rRNA (guanosine(2251)-2'-O)-methyltransferase RlmB [Fuchsiella alkaliacetigena]MCK8826009.1 23S rRNA (guanosine(2251)-2'-O)-methyltransferase RlmB [Fuchsiella alkaliacetigena]